MNNILNVPEIQLQIRSKHEKFIEKYAPQIEKVMADHKLLVDSTAAKLNRILLCFKEEGIIDEVKVSDQGPLRKMTLIKQGCPSYINVITNGRGIYLESLKSVGFASDSDGLIIGNDLVKDYQSFYGASDGDYDWVGFSIKLLDTIHAKIYDRKEVMDEKIREIFADNTKKKTK